MGGSARTSNAGGRRKLSKPGPAFVPLTFALGEAFQFDWSTEYAFVGGLRRKLEVAHTKLCASRAFWLTAYYSQSHEMLFDAHARAFAAFGGVPRRGIYDNMKTAVDKVGRGKERDINPRFYAMCGHYLFDPNSAMSPVVGRKAASRRTSRIAADRYGTRPASVAGEISTNSTSGGEQCRQAWADTANPEWPALTIAELLQDELMQMLPAPQPFDGLRRETGAGDQHGADPFPAQSLSVPAEYAHAVLSLRIYPAELRLVADGKWRAMCAASSVTRPSTTSRTTSASSTGNLGRSGTAPRSPRCQNPCCGSSASCSSRLAVIVSWPMYLASSRSMARKPCWSRSNWRWSLAARVVSMS